MVSRFARLQSPTSYEPDGHLYWALLKLGGTLLMLNAKYEDEERPAQPPPTVGMTTLRFTSIALSTKPKQNLLKGATGRAACIRPSSVSRGSPVSLQRSQSSLSCRTGDARYH
jgi:hypothetical protein